MFFNKVTRSLSKASLTYNIFIIMADFNIDINTTEVEVNKCDEFCNLFDLINFFFCLGFLSQPFTDHRTAGEGDRQNRDMLN